MVRVRRRRHRRVSSAEARPESLSGVVVVIVSAIGDGVRSSMECSGLRLRRLEDYSRAVPADCGGHL